jgi:hypothetical protein
MAYTPSGLRAKNNLTFGSLVNDQNRIGMTGSLGNTILSQDATGTPVTSPVTNMSGSGAALTVPANAVQFTINSTVSIQIGEDSSYAQGLNIPANTLWVIDCARIQYLYLKPSNGTNTVSFQFKIV